MRRAAPIRSSNLPAGVDMSTVHDPSSFNARTTPTLVFCPVCQLTRSPTLISAIVRSSVPRPDARERAPRI